MDNESIEERRRRLEERLMEVKSNPVVAVRLDKLANVIIKLNEDKKLRELLGDTVLKHLALVWDKKNDDILITDANMEIMDDMKKIVFLKTLREVIERE